MAGSGCRAAGAGVRGIVPGVGDNAAWREGSAAEARLLREARVVSQGWESWASKPHWVPAKDDDK